MQNILKNRYVQIGLAVIIASTFGYWFAPVKVQEKIVEKEVQVEVEKIVYKEKESKNKKKHTIIVRTKNPDGSITERIEIVESDQSIVEIDKTQDTVKVVEKIVEKEKIIEKQKALTTVSAIAKSPLSFKELKPSYGAMVQRTIFGPVSVGAFGYTDRTLGVSIGLSF